MEEGGGHLVNEATRVCVANAAGQKKNAKLSSISQQEKIT